MTEDTKAANFIDFMVTSAGPALVKSEYEANNNNVTTLCNNAGNGAGGGGIPSEFSIEYWNSPSGLGLSIEKEDPALWESTLLEDMTFFNAKMAADLDQAPESSTGGESHYAFFFTAIDTRAKNSY